MTKREQIFVIARAVSAPLSKQIGAMRCKLCVRQRLCKCVGPLCVCGDLEDVDDGDLYEFMFYTNVGDSMHDVMEALAHYGGGRCNRVIL